MLDDEELHFKSELNQGTIKSYHCKTLDCKGWCICMKMWKSLANCSYGVWQRELPAV